MSKPAYSQRLDEAAAFAIAAFRNKFRKCSRTPYLMHLFGVCAFVGEFGGSEDQMIAALLHDYLEDIEDASAEHLEAKFGAEVRRMVEALSDSLSLEKPPWRERKQQYLHHLQTESPDVKLVSAADKLHNCLSILHDFHIHGDAVFDRFTAKKSGTLWYYRAVTAALAVHWEHPILSELDRAVKELERSTDQVL